ncbi:hypothetical protein BOX15_Mlig015912g1, partial [Macrostomum lignano]
MELTKEKTISLQSSHAVQSVTFIPTLNLIAAASPRQDELVFEFFDASSGLRLINKQYPKEKLKKPSLLQDANQSNNSHAVDQKPIGVDVNETQLNKLSGASSTVVTDFFHGTGQFVLSWGNRFSIRRDLNGTLLLDSLLDCQCSDKDEIVNLDLTVTDATHLHALLNEFCDLDSADQTDQIAADELRDAYSQLGDGLSRVGQRSGDKHARLVLSGQLDGLLQRLSTLQDYLVQSQLLNNPGVPVLASLIDRLVQLRPDPPINPLELARTADKSVFNSEANRRETFATWPHMHYKWALPEAMAAAGFYHSPPDSDRALCFACIVCLVSWEPTDEPWSEHERHSPNCVFVKNEFTNNVPLIATQATEPARITQRPVDIIGVSNSPMILPTSSLDGDLSLWDLSLRYRVRAETSIKRENDLFTSSSESNRSVKVNALLLCDANVDRLAVLVACQLANQPDANWEPALLVYRIDRSEVSYLDSSSHRRSRRLRLLDRASLTAPYVSLQAPRPANHPAAVAAATTATSATTVVAASMDGYIVIYHSLLQLLLLDNPLESGFRISHMVRTRIPLLPLSTNPTIDEAAIADCALLKPRQLLLLAPDPMDDSAPAVSVAVVEPVAKRTRCDLGDASVAAELGCAAVLTCDSTILVVDLDRELVTYRVAPPPPPASPSGDVNAVSQSESLESSAVSTTGSYYTRIEYCCGLDKLVAARDRELHIFNVSRPDPECLETMRPAGSVSADAALSTSATQGMVASEELELDGSSRPGANVDSSSSVAAGAGGVPSSLLGSGAAGEAAATVGGGSASSSSSLFRQPLIDSYAKLLELTQYEYMTPRFMATVGPCWTELQPEQQQRLHPMYQLGTGSAGVGGISGIGADCSRSFKLTPDSASWSEHLIDIVLLKSVCVGHIDLKLTIDYFQQPPPNIAVTLLTLNVSGSSVGSKDPDSISLPYIDDDSSLPLSSDQLKALNAEVIAGPYNLAEYLDGSGRVAYITMTSLELIRCRTRNFAIHIKYCCSPQQQQQAEQQQQQQQAPGNKPSASTIRQGCDCIREMTICVRKFKRTSLPKERQQRLALLTDSELHRAAVQLLADGSLTPGREPVPSLLALLNWILSILYHCPGGDTRLPELIGEQADNLVWRLLLQNQRTVANLALRLFNSAVALRRSACAPGLARAVSRHVTRLAEVRSPAGLANFFALANSLHLAGYTCDRLEERLAKLLVELSVSLRDRSGEFYPSVLRSQACLYHNPLEPELFDLDPVVAYRLRASLRAGPVGNSGSAAAAAAASGGGAMPSMGPMTAASTAPPGAAGYSPPPYGWAGWAIVPLGFSSGGGAGLGLGSSAAGSAGAGANIASLSQSVPMLVPKVALPGEWASAAASGNCTSTLMAAAAAAAAAAATSGGQGGGSGRPGSDDDRVSDVLRLLPPPVTSTSEIQAWQTRGLIEVEPLHFTCCLATGGTRIEYLDTCQAYPMASAGSASASAAMASAAAASASGQTAAGVTAASSAGAAMPSSAAAAAASEKKSLEAKLMDPTPPTPKTTPATTTHTTPLFATPSVSPPPPDELDEEAGAAAAASGKAPSGGDIAEATAAAAAAAAAAASAAARLSSHSTAASHLLNPPQPLALVVDRMHPGARRFVILDFGHSVLLTDVLIPACSDLGSISVTVWNRSEEIDSLRLAVSTDIGSHPLVLTDLYPPPLCRFLKVAIIGKMAGSTPNRTRIPLGAFFGHSCLDATLESAQQLKAVAEENLCRYGMACAQLQRQLDSLANTPAAGVGGDSSGAAAAMPSSSGAASASGPSALHHQLPSLFGGPATAASPSLADPMLAGRLRQAYDNCCVLQRQVNIAQQALARVLLLQQQPQQQQQQQQAAQIGSDKAKSIMEEALRLLLSLTSSSDLGWSAYDAFVATLTDSETRQLFTDLIVCGSKSMQLMACGLLSQLTPHLRSPENWWSDWLSSLLNHLLTQNRSDAAVDKELAKSSQEQQQPQLVPCDRLFLLLSTLLQKMSPNSVVLDSLLALLARQINEETLLRQNWELLGWLLLLVSRALDHVTPPSQRWDFLAWHHLFASESSGKTNRREFRFNKRKLQKRLMHHKQMLMELSKLKEEFLSSKTKLEQQAEPADHAKKWMM